MTPASHTRTIGLYGGSFNPPHVAHICTVAWALSTGEVDEVWIIPTGGHPFGKDLAPFEHRFEMCRLAFDLFAGRVSILDIEKQERVHYSVETVQKLRGDNPGVGWRWIIGSDALAQSADWKNFEELTRLAPLLVIGREGHPAEEPRDKIATKSDGEASTPRFTLPDISSTYIRVHLAAGEREGLLRDIIPHHVMDYIRRHRLYGVASSPS